MSGLRWAIHVAVRQIGDSAGAAGDVRRIRRYHGEVVDEADGALTLGFHSVPDAVAYAGSLIDDTADDPGSVAVGVGDIDEARSLAEAAVPGQVLAAASVESRSRGRLSCGLSFTRETPQGAVRYKLLVPDADERFADVE